MILAGSMEGSLLTLANAGGWDAWMEIVGRFHVVVVHFPIALLVAAGVGEGWRTIRRRGGIAPGVVVLMAGGTVGAVVSVVLGLFHEEFFGAGAAERELVEIHEWLGIATAVVAVIGVGLGVWAMRSGGGGRVAGYRGAVFLAAILVGVTGHYGGELTHGIGFLTAPAGKESPTTVRAPASRPGVVGGVDFVRDVWPILEEQCVDCHKAGKSRGGLALDSRAAMAKGGKSGVLLVPGKGGESLLIRRLRGEGGKERMPKDADPLSEGQVEILRRWIEEGAN